MATKCINDRECFVCHSQGALHIHHIYAGCRRSASEKYGLKVYLCPAHHNMSNEGVHFLKPLDDYIKKFGQKWFEENVGTHEEFIQIFGKNYI